MSSCSSITAFFCVKCYFFVYHFNFLVSCTMFFGVIFLVVVLRMTINTLIYKNPVQTGTSLISIDYKTFAPIQLHSLLDVLCYSHTNSILIHYKPFNSFTFITLCGFLLNQNYYKQKYSHGLNVCIPTKSITL